MGEKLSSGMEKRLFVRAIALIVIAALAALAVARFDDVAAALEVVGGILTPLLAGAAIAYCLNLIMERFECIFFPRSNSAVVARLRRPVCLILAIGVIAAFVAFVVVFVSSDLREAFTALPHGIAVVAAALEDVLTSGVFGEGESISRVAAMLAGDVEAWKDSLGEAAEDLGGYSTLASVAVQAGKSVTTVVIDAVVALVFAIYLLMDKERALSGTAAFARWVLPERAFEKAAQVVRIANECFSRFIFGQCLEGTILGCLCALGMTIFGMPHAGAIGLCVGMTSLVPLVGAWVGGIVGALMLLSGDPMQAVWFVLFLVVLQQIEGHAIYPNVVGTSVGVPSIWVLVAVFAGGTLFGIVGILLGVPVVATILRLAEEHGKQDEKPPHDSAPETPVAV